MPLKDKQARRQYYKTWCARNKEKIRQYKAVWRENNRERIRAINSRSYLKLRDRIIERRRTVREQNRTQVREYERNYYQKNKERRQPYWRTYYLRHKEQITAYHTRTRERIRETQRARVRKNLEQVRRYRHAYNARAYELVKGNPKQQLAHGIRKRFRMALYQQRKSASVPVAKRQSAVKLLGCTINEAMRYLEAQFKLGMSWENWSVRGWHIDHIRPLSSFDLTDPHQLAQACHYTNLQPLWARENIQKGGRL